MEKHIYDEKNGLYYTLGEDGMYYPDIVLEEQEDYQIGKYGRMRERFLKEHRAGTYTSLLMAGKLHVHLYEIDTLVHQRVEEIVLKENIYKQLDYQCAVRYNNKDKWIWEDIMITNIDNTMLKGKKFIDLFAGLGGFRIALESLGAQCVYTSEWEKSVSQVYFDNFGDHPDGDITKVDEKTIPDHDILCAGFPCQAFSISGKQKGFEDSRGTLFFDVARIIKEKRPSVVFMENVKNFASHDDGQTLLVVQNTMEELGYTFFQKVLNATDYGIPQKRERIYMVCFRKDLNVTAFTYPKAFKLDKHVEDFLINENDVPQELFVSRDDIYMTNKVDDIYSSKSIRLGTVNKGGQGERIYSTKGIAITLSAYGGGVFAKTGGYLVNGKYRRLHPLECARIMGFPEDYKVCENRNQAYQQFGNSVVIDVLQYVAIEFAKKLIQSEKSSEVSDERIAI